MQVIRQVYGRWRGLVHELAKFGTIGVLCYVIDVGLYNVLHVGFHMEPIAAKTISTIVAATSSYAGNRHWSFRHRGSQGVRREFVLFFIYNAIGLAITLAFLGFGVHVLHQDSALATNIWGNLIGTGFATIFRFYAYKKWVFLHPEDPKVQNNEARPDVSERLPAA